MNSSKVVESRSADSELQQGLGPYGALSFWQDARADARPFGGLRQAFQTLGFWSILSYRVANLLSRSGLDLPARLVQFAAQLIFGSYINRKAVIGPSCVVMYPTGVFIGPHCRLGKGCTIGIGAFIGSNCHPADPLDYPRLDDSVAVSPGARVMGPVVIGAGSSIGPNVVVLRSVPANSIVLPAAPRVMSREYFGSSGTEA